MTIPAYGEWDFPFEVKPIVVGAFSNELKIFVDSEYLTAPTVSVRGTAVAAPG